MRWAMLAVGLAGASCVERPEAPAPRDTGTEDTDTGSPDTDTDTGAPGGIVEIAFRGVVTRATDTPFGMTRGEVEGAAAEGRFTYDLGIPDDEPDDPGLGLYLHLGSGSLEILVAGHVVTGSGHAITTVQDRSSDAWSFLDGEHTTGGPRTMTVDGEPDEAASFSYAIVGPSDIFDDDAQPARFPVVDIEAETYQLFDVTLHDGTVRVEVETLEQVGR